MFVCHRCSRVFYHGAPPGGLLPAHRDALLGMPCAATNMPILGVLDLDPGRVEPPQVDEPDSWGLRPCTNLEAWDRPRAGGHAAHGSA